MRKDGWVLVGLFGFSLFVFFSSGFRLDGLALGKGRKRKKRRKSGGEIEEEKKGCIWRHD